MHGAVKGIRHKAGGGSAAAVSGVRDGGRGGHGMNVIATLPDGKEPDLSGLIYKGNRKIYGNSTLEIQINRGFGILLFGQLGAWEGLNGCYLYFASVPANVVLVPIKELYNATVVAKIVKEEAAEYAVVTIENTVMADFSCYIFEFRTHF